MTCLYKPSWCSGWKSILLYSLRHPFGTCISSVLLLLLAGAALCREPLTSSLSTAAGLTPYLLASLHAVGCTFSPTHRIRSSWTPGLLYYTLRNRRPRKGDIHALQTIASEFCLPFPRLDIDLARASRQSIINTNLTRKEPPELL